MSTDFAALLQRSEELEDTVFNILEKVDYENAFDDLRLDAGIGLAMVSTEHGRRCAASQRMDSSSPRCR